MVNDLSRQVIDPIPDLHDWEIVRVGVNRFTKIAEILMRYPGRDDGVLLRLHGVGKFFLSGMLVQNVVLDVLMFEESRPDSDYFMRCCKLLHITPAEFAQRIGNKLVYFEPSVGAELACTFLTIESIVESP